MRKIDADVLKETISEEVCRKFVRWDKTITVAEFETFVKDIIDNAPTVPILTPTEGDCISRSALKEAIDKDAEDICGIEDVIDYIDNAQTVEFERPKGDWKKDNIGTYCSVCKCHLIKTPFCPFCGADMRKGGTEE